MPSQREPLPYSTAESDYRRAPLPPEAPAASAPPRKRSAFGAGFFGTLGAMTAMLLLVALAAGAIAVLYTTGHHPSVNVQNLVPEATGSPSPSQ